MIYTLGDRIPRIDDSAYVADNATIIGSVEIGPEASIWFGTILRGDNDVIRIGARSNVQDATVIHVDPGIPTTIGEDVTIGHSTMIHGCTIERGCLIGIGAIILDHARIGEESLVGANSLVTEGKEFPGRSLILGSPARVVRPLTDEDIAAIRRATNHYVDNTRYYKANLKPWSPGGD